ncbi:MAG: sugar transferase [Acidimicrobiales bacterium]|nr:sugar transferase [Acidimicrobiales bacterium]MCB1248744.1 sugar transferase [Acidimicrobiales bacterium]MCB1260723.1 sugar transferase [Acidimicrobiales bacterium]
MSAATHFTLQEPALDIVDAGDGRSDVGAVVDRSVDDVGAPPRRSAAARAVKRGEDLVGCLLALPLLVVVLPIVALVVRLDSSGPVFFRQRRVGRDGREFAMLKFRSMYTDAEARLDADPELHAQWLAHDCKLPEEIDPRITRVGRFLRRTSLDELPQVLNVLAGQMSLVGPRPIERRQIEHLYGDRAAWYEATKPGLTGLWQVSGRSTIQGDARVALDIAYVRAWSPWRDLVLVLRTVPAVLRSDGAH